jgi:hypothetical protein
MRSKALISGALGIYDIGFISQPKVAFQGLLQDPPIVFIKSTPI